MLEARTQLPALTIWSIPLAIRRVLLWLSAHIVSLFVRKVHCTFLDDLDDACITHILRNMAPLVHAGWMKTAMRSLHATAST